MSLPVGLSRQENCSVSPKDSLPCKWSRCQCHHRSIEGRRRDHAADFQATGGVADRFNRLRSACQQGAAMRISLTGQRI